MNGEFTDRDMWVAIRAALLGIAKVIKDQADGGPLAVSICMGLLAITDAIERRWDLKKRRVLDGKTQETRLPLLEYHSHPPE